MACVWGVVLTHIQCYQELLNWFIFDHLDLSFSNGTHDPYKIIVVTERLSFENQYSVSTRAFSLSPNLRRYFDGEVIMCPIAYIQACFWQLLLVSTNYLISREARADVQLFWAILYRSVPIFNIPRTSAFFITEPRKRSINEAITWAYFQDYHYFITCRAQICLQAQWGMRMDCLTKSVLLFVTHFR